MFKIKYRGGPIDISKLSAARVVVRGQFMREGLNFNDTFAPVAKAVTIRAVLAIATKFGALLFQVISKRLFSLRRWIVKPMYACHPFGQKGVNLLLEKK